MVVCEKQFSEKRIAPLQLLTSKNNGEGVDIRNDRLASAVEALTAAVMHAVSAQRQRPTLMKYEEAAEVLGLGITTLESMVNSGRLREGRHYIKEGRSVRFHFDLVDLMFEDKMQISDAGGKSDDPPVPSSRQDAVRRRPRGSSSFNVNYR